MTLAGRSRLSVPGSQADTQRASWWTAGRSPGTHTHTHTHSLSESAALSCQLIKYILAGTSAPLRRVAMTNAAVAVGRSVGRVDGRCCICQRAKRRLVFVCLSCSACYQLLPRHAVACLLAACLRCLIAASDAISERALNKTNGVGASKPVLVPCNAYVHIYSASVETAGCVACRRRRPTDGLEAGAVRFGQRKGRYVSRSVYVRICTECGAAACVRRRSLCCTIA